MKKTTKQSNVPELQAYSDVWTSINKKLNLWSLTPMGINTHVHLESWRLNKEGVYPSALIEVENTDHILYQQGSFFYGEVCTYMYMA